MSVADVDVANWKREVEDLSTLVAVEFWSPTCGWCQRLEPIYQELANEYSGRIKFGKVDVSTQPQLAARYGVMGTPTIKLLCLGRPVGEHIGFASNEQLKAKLDEALKNYRICFKQSSPYA